LAGAIANFEVAKDLIDGVSNVATELSANYSKYQDVFSALSGDLELGDFNPDENQKLQNKVSELAKLMGVEASTI